jgi:tRNA(fMet)-specific endonuclease VapC
MTYLLDTNTCVEYLRQRNLAVIERISATLSSEIGLCSIVKAELYHGAYRSQQTSRNLAKVEKFIAPYLSIPFDDTAGREYGRLRADLELRGLIIGPYDLQVASIALVHGLTVVTHNVSEFSRVAGLKWEDWQGTT